MSYHNAGRELDALVCGAVFEPWDESKCRVCGWPLVADGEKGCWKDNCSMRFPDGMYPPRADAPGHYSTDIAAAWQVVERLKADWRPVIQWVHLDRWRVTLVNRHKNNEAVMEESPSLPLAICRAALETAVGASQP